MIRLGNIDLSDHLLLPGIKNIPLRAMSVRTTLGGRPVLQGLGLHAGQEISLVDPGEFGLFTGAQVDAINLYRASGEIVEFIHHQGSWKVVVTGVDVEQADGLADPDGDDSYFGTITMRITG